MQNPAFPAIKASGFNNFIGFPFFQSFNQYYGEDLKDLWFKGVEENLLKPQFHAREHLWLKDLKLGNKDTQLGFEHDFFAVKTKTSSTLRNNYLATYFSETEREFERVSSSTKIGLDLKNNFLYNNNQY